MSLGPLLGALLDGLDLILKILQDALSGEVFGVDAQRQPSSYRVGDRAGIFRVHALSDSEVVLGDSDRHLDVQVSLMRLPGPEGAPSGTFTAAMSTVVHVHNALGRIYMLGVTPAHRVIAPAVVAKLAG